MTARWETILAGALRSEDPVAVLCEASNDRALPPAVRRAFTRAVKDGHGLQMSALLVAKLRFERLMRGSGALSEWFERDPETFTATFHRYHRETPLSAVFPTAEARDFAKFCEREQTLAAGR
jgi:hypothetical protein